MRCHYEVLGVSRDADYNEIKKCYRKLALKNHPDKNPDNMEEYSKIFRDIQAAYDVLSDKQERAWYDKHREAILRSGENYVDDSVDIMQYFNPGVYCGYNDGPNGFYTIFRDVFRKVAEEEEAFLEGDSDEEYNVPPDFGDSENDYDSVVKLFYSHWLGHCTKRSFAWKDKYDIRQAPNRPTQRLMEKENKKVRDGFKRKRNEEVRALVQYVRKRDRRVQEYINKLEALKAEGKRKAEEKRTEEKRLRNQALDGYTEQDWMTVDDSRLDDIDSHFADQFGNTHKMTYDDFSDEEKEVEIVEEFYCIACDKSFKSEKALSNHEKSKKHRENIELIKSEMDDDLFQELCLGNITNANDNSPTSLSDSDITSSLNQGQSSGKVEDPIHRIDSMNLPQNIVLRNVIDRTEKQIDCSIPEDSALSHSTNSAKVKEKKKGKKLKNQRSYDDDDNDNNDSATVEEWGERQGAAQGLTARDSLALPRRKSKKKEVRESAERLRNEDEVINDGMLNVTLGDSSITDSIRIHRKKPTKAEKKKAKMFLIENDGSGTESETEDMEDNVVDDRDNVPSSKQNITENSVEDDDSESNGEAKFNRSVIADSIRYNKDKMEHHARNNIHTKKGKSPGPDDSGEDEKSARLDKTVIKDSMKYHKDKMQRHAKNTIYQKKYKQMIDTDTFVEEELSEDIEAKCDIKETAESKISEGRGKNENAQTLNRTPSTENNNDDCFACGVCGYEFPTRNKLFTHIKAEGHVQMKQQPVSTGKNGGKKGSKKNR